MVQFIEVETAQPKSWRLLAAQRRAPLALRVKAWLHDAHLDVGSHLLPTHSNGRIARLLIVMSGNIRIEGKSFHKGDIVAISDKASAVSVLDPADVLLVAADMLEQCFAQGLSSGNTIHAGPAGPVPLLGTSRSRFDG